jgi:N-terminal acetyltransferase B complex non-catalytic subunit
MPNDDLMLLAVQQLLYSSSKSSGSGSNSTNENKTMILSAVLLESAIDHSPDNAYLKIAAMEVYHNLHASTRVWELFEGIGLKHIQLDSCSYVVLPYLLEGGLYNEAIELSSALLRFQKGASRDCGDYAGRAMENGTLSKANEFLAFQRSKLNPSLIFQFCKGLILDSAPLFATAVPRSKSDDDPIFKGGLGITQGLVGSDDDMERTIQMVVENHNPYAALSVMSWASFSSVDDGEKLSDNRDLSLLKHFNTLMQPKVEKKAVMIRETIRRGHFHGLLVRATLCFDAMKGPKKGKLVKPSEQLMNRTQDLLDAVLSASESRYDNELPDGIHRSLSQTIYSLCRFLAVVNAGMPMVDDEESMGAREERASEMMKEHCQIHLTAARKQVDKITDLNVVYYLMPSFIVPMFAIFRMSASICEAYGWGKRKAKTKKCAAAMVGFAAEFGQLIQGLMKCLNALPSCMPTDVSSNVDLTEDETSILDPTILLSTVRNVQESRYRKRLRIEPVLHEMDEYLDEFNVTE